MVAYVPDSLYAGLGEYRREWWPPERASLAGRPAPLPLEAGGERGAASDGVPAAEDHRGGTGPAACSCSAQRRF